MLHWSEILQYDVKNPLLFSSYAFLFFLTAAYAIFTVIYKKARWRNLFLFGFSLFFYFKSGGYYFWLLILSTVIDYYCGSAIYKAASKTKKRVFLILSLTSNLGLLAFFKYSTYFVSLINGAIGTELKAINFMSVLANGFGGSYDIYTILLPVGISFYTFQTLSYSIDIYRGSLKPASNIIDFGFFVTFFPQLVAGPIVRASEFFPQMSKPFHLTRQILGSSMFLIMAGLFKKAVISDYISVNFVDPVFSNPLAYSGFSNLMAIYGYAVQIYCDFSGYSDMAIGIAALFGFKLPLNFNSPYKALSITDFWRRWHISLSSWLRDYLYISLGGNRKGKIRTYVNLMITMLLGGLWHGAATRFIIWGGLHGAALAVHKMWSENINKGMVGIGAFASSLVGLFVYQSWMSIQAAWIIWGLSLVLIFIGAVRWNKPQLFNGNTLFYKLLMGFITFHFVCFCWIYFRAKNLEIMGNMIYQIGENFTGTSVFLWEDLKRRIVEYRKPMAMIVFGLLIHFTPEAWKDKTKVFLTNTNAVSKAFILMAFVFVVFQFKSADIVPFVYFDF
jgi:alginate O-acetyltransferase complex protein AlgI